jgi:transcriptional regulator with XRE-family HTH domain
MHDICLKKFRSQLALRGLFQWQVANAMGTNPSTFSAWLSGQNVAPVKLRARIEAFLGVEPGSLMVQAQAKKA